MRRPVKGSATEKRDIESSFWSIWWKRVSTVVLILIRFADDPFFFSIEYEKAAEKCPTILDGDAKLHEDGSFFS
jgi:hypothetical protein